MTERKKAGVLWSNENDGKVTLNITLDGIGKFVGWKNTFKEKATDQDFNIYWDAPQDGQRKTDSKDV